MSKVRLFFIIAFITAVILTGMTIQQLRKISYDNGYQAGKSEIAFITKERVVTKVVEPEGVITSLTVKDLYTHLATKYPHISSVDRDTIMIAIAKASDKHQLSPLVLFSLLSVESSFRWWIDHDLVTVENWEGHKVKTRAIGLGGVVYEIWGKKLKDAGIIETKSDLYTIDRNIASAAFIYSHLKSLPLHPKATNPIESGLIRYFGGGYRSYFNKIDAQIALLLKSKVY